MRVTVKLFSNLMEYLPPGTEGNSLVLQLPDSASGADILDRFKIPADAVKVVMINGEFQAAEKRSERLSDGDTLSIWPAIQGG
jgi:sulfur carrier protein ThiS